MPRFKISLATLLILSLASGFVLWLNMHPRVVWVCKKGFDEKGIPPGGTHYEYGLPVYWAESDSWINELWFHGYERLSFDLVIWLFVLGVTGLLTEYLVRRSYRSRRVPPTPVSS